MHAKPDLRVVLEWTIASSGSVIAAVILRRFNLTLSPKKIFLLLGIAVATPFIATWFAQTLSDHLNSIPLDETRESQLNLRYELLDWETYDSFRYQNTISNKHLVILLFRRGRSHPAMLETPEFKTFIVSNHIRLFDAFKHFEISDPELDRLASRFDRTQSTEFIVMAANAKEHFICKIPHVATYDARSAFVSQLLEKISKELPD